MKILLIDIDSIKGNLALATISGYFKERGYTVGFNVSEPDEIYISCIFKENGAQARGVAITKELQYPKAKVYVGGSGISWEMLPEKMQKCKPDLDLYGWKKSVGRTSIGCIRDCGFCVVRKKEGYWKKWMHVLEFWDERFDRVDMLDNNIYADKKWFFENTDFILEHNLKVDIEQGMDIRILDQEIAKRIRKLKNAGYYWHFAFDSMKDEKAVRKGIVLLQKSGFNIRYEVSFYVLVGYNTSIKEDKYRCRLLKKLGTNAFVMPYVITKWTEKIARWANRKWLFWSCDIDDFAPEFAD